MRLNLPEVISKIYFEAFSSIFYLGEALFEGNSSALSYQEEQQSLNKKDLEKGRKIFLRSLLILFLGAFYVSTAQDTVKVNKTVTPEEQAQQHYNDGIVALGKGEGQVAA